MLSISAGYYHESPEDTPIDTSIAEVLGDLGRAGVVVVAGAGNDATERPLLPAGLAAVPAGPSQVALVSVGSLNPNGSTVALFSNAGEWVTTYRSGAAIVSTLPISGNAGTQSSTAAAGVTPDKRSRTTIDVDDFSGGFGVWSGTSFAAPLLAGQVAKALADLGTDDISLPAMLERGQKAVTLVLRAAAMTTTAPLGAKAATAFAAYRDGDRERLRELVALRHPAAVAHGAFAAGPAGDRRGRHPDRLAAAGGRRRHDHRPEGRRLLAGGHRQAGDLAAAPPRRQGGGTGIRACRRSPPTAPLRTKRSSTTASGCSGAT